MDAPQILALFKQLQHVTTLCRQADDARDAFCRCCNPDYDAEKDGYNPGYDREPNIYENVPPKLLQDLKVACAALGSSITDRMLENIIVGDLHAFSDPSDSAGGALRSTLEGLRVAAHGIIAAIMGDEAVQYFEETYDAALLNKLRNRQHSFGGELQQGLKEFRKDHTVRQTLVDHAVNLSVRETEQPVDTTFARYQVVKAMVMRAVRAAEMVHHVGWHEHAHVRHVDSALACVHEVREFISLGALHELDTLLSECAIHGKWTAKSPAPDNYSLKDFEACIDHLVVALTTNRYTRNFEWARTLRCSIVTDIANKLVEVENSLSATMVNRLKDIPRLEPFCVQRDNFSSALSLRQEGRTEYWLGIARSLASLRAPAEVAQEQMETQAEVEKMEVEETEIETVALIKGPALIKVPSSANSIPATVKPDGPQPLNEFWHGGQYATLQPKSFSVVSYLWNAPSRSSHVDPVAIEIWGDEEAGSGKLKNAISKANEAFEQAGLPWKVRRSGQTIALVT